jgi:GYF domain 2
MADEWFYVENGESLGPVSTEELGRKVAGARGEPKLVWTPGMPEWVDARTLPQFAPRSAPATDPRPAAAALRPAMGASPVSAAGPAVGSGPGLAAGGLGEAKSLLRRAKHEIISYLAISTYLMVWFVALMFYKATILRSVGVEFAPFGFAIVKALILGKFMLVLEAARLGERRTGGNSMIVQIVIKALLFTLALIVMSMIEEIIVGHFHGRDAREVLKEMAGGSLAQVFASAILMFLVLLPYMAFRRVALTIGDLPDMLFGKGPAPRAE